MNSIFQEEMDTDPMLDEKRKIGKFVSCIEMQGEKLPIDIGNLGLEHSSHTLNSSNIKS